MVMDQNDQIKNKKCFSVALQTCRGFNIGQTTKTREGTFSGEIAGCACLRRVAGGSVPSSYIFKHLA